MYIYNYDCEDDERDFNDVYFFNKRRIVCRVEDFVVD